MDSIQKNQKVLDSLVKNSNISDTIKPHLSSMISHLAMEFPNISLDNLENRIATLKVLRGSKYVTNEAMQYNIATNQIFINKDALASEDIDADFQMYKCILSMVSAKDNYYGFGGNSRLEALNQGTTEIIANHLNYGNDGKSNFEDEQVLTEMLADVVGIDNFLNAYFNNDPDFLMRLLLNKYTDVKTTFDYLDDMNYNMHFRMSSGISRLNNLQERLVEMYGAKKDFIVHDKSLVTTAEKSDNIGFRR